MNTTNPCAIQWDGIPGQAAAAIAPVGPLPEGWRDWHEPTQTSVGVWRQITDEGVKLNQHQRESSQPWACQNVAAIPDDETFLERVWVSESFRWLTFENAKLPRTLGVPRQTGLSGEWFPATQSSDGSQWIHVAGLSGRSVPVDFLDQAERPAIDPERRPGWDFAVWIPWVRLAPKENQWDEGLTRYTVQLPRVVRAEPGTPIPEGWEELPEDHPAAQVPAWVPSADKADSLARAWRETDGSRRAGVAAVTPAGDGFAAWDRTSGRGPRKLGTFATLAEAAEAGRAAHQPTLDRMAWVTGQARQPFVVLADSPSNKHVWNGQVLLEADDETRFFAQQNLGRTVGM